jgi:hypothetical protein
MGLALRSALPNFKVDTPLNLSRPQLTKVKII